MAGENLNKQRQELWEGPINRSFDQPDGIKRIDDEINSAWLIRFFELTSFVGLIYK